MSEFDEHDRLVKNFAYEYVSFNHDPSHLYLVNNVTDDNMLELEGMSGQFAPSCFRRRVAPTAGGDGCFCVHHPDDPAHTKACYEEPQP